MGKIWFCLLSPACLTISMQNLIEYEGNLIGVQWYNANEIYDDFSFSTGVIMLWVDYLLYMVLALYFDHVWPSRYGSQFVPWFCLLPSYWKGKDINANDDLTTDLTLSQIKYDNKNEENANIFDTETFENVKDQYNNVEPSIKIRNLHKYYYGNVFEGKGRVVKAVNGINLDIYEGEVFCLLGHNGLYTVRLFACFVCKRERVLVSCFGICVFLGAGKTTTVDMLSGMTTVTKGDAWILNHHVSNSMEEIRKNLGVCPQHNILFSKLSVCNLSILF